MKSKDQQLLEEAYNKIVLKEGLTETFVKKLFTEIAFALKEKAPQIFKKLVQCKNGEELQQLLLPSIQQESSSDINGLLSKLFTMLKNPGATTAITGGILHLLGLIIATIAPGFAGGFAAVGGLLLICLTSVLHSDSKQ